MYITWLGQSCFKIQDKIGSDGVTLVTDPFDKNIGLKVPNFEANIITISHDHDDHNNSDALRGNPVIIKSPGEYDINGISIQGIDSFHDDKKGEDRGSNIIFRFEVDGISIGHLGDLGHVLGESELEALSGVDILMVPVGGKYTIDCKKAIEVINQIEPRIIIPMHYKVEGLKIDIDPVEKFIREIGIEPIYEEKLKIAKKDLPQEDMELVVLSV